MHALLAATLLVTLLATPVAAEVVESRLGVVEGVVIDDAKVGIAGATVRIVGEAIVTTTSANTYGQFRVTLLPPGSYRIEVARGTIREPYPRIELDRRDYRTCILPPPRRTFAQPSVAPFPIRTAKPARIIDPTTTTLGVRLGSREIGGR